MHEILKARNVARGAAFNQCASLDRTLNVSLGRKLADFVVPKDCVIRPIKVGEVRVSLPTGKAIFEVASNTALIELSTSVAHVPLLVFDCDRSSVNLAMLHYLMEQRRLLVLYKGDDDHDDWNCVKTAAGVRVATPTWTCRLVAARGMAHAAPLLPDMGFTFLAKSQVVVRGNRAATVQEGVVPLG